MITAKDASEWPDQPIFIIDDDLAWITVLTGALRSLGWSDVRSLSEPRHALAIAREFRPAVILLDLFMAERNGAEILDEFHSEWPDLPIVIVTGSEKVQNAVACMRKGARDYLTKPLQRAVLERSLKRIIQGDGMGGHAAEPAGNGCVFEEMLPKLSLLPNLKEVPDLLIGEALRRSNGVIKDAAFMLGISSQAICNRRRRAECHD